MLLAGCWGRLQLSAPGSPFDSLPWKTEKDTSFTATHYLPTGCRTLCLRRGAQKSLMPPVASDLGLRIRRAHGVDSYLPSPFGAMHSNHQAVVRTAAGFGGLRWFREKLRPATFHNRLHAPARIRDSGGRRRRAGAPSTSGRGTEGLCRDGVGQLALRSGTTPRDEGGGS